MTDTNQTKLGKADIEARFAAFEPEKPAEPTPADRERKRRHNRIDTIVDRAVSDLRHLGLVFAADAEMSIAALDSLEQVGFQAHAAVNTIPDNKLVTPAEAAKTPRAPRQPRKPREPKPETAPKPDETIETPAPEPETTVEEKVEPESNGVEETPAEMDARIKAERAQRAAESEQSKDEAPAQESEKELTYEEFQKRKQAEAAAAAAGPRGDVDPNAGDGF